VQLSHFTKYGLNATQSMNNLTEPYQSFRPENQLAFRMQKHSLLHGNCSLTNTVSVNYSA